jgi:16S rRNA processing protein RimM
MAERVCIAQFGAAHGVRGEVRLKSFTADPMDVTRYGELELEDGSRSFRIEAARPQKDMLVVRLAGVRDRNAAEALTNRKLFVPRERLPAPDEGEFYYADLVGLPATTKDGEPFGTVIAVHDFGAGDILEIKPTTGPTIMLPFTEAAVPVVDVAGGRLVVDPPAETSAEPEPKGRQAG